MSMQAATVRYAAVYIRVSTEEQAELSPESQLEKIREFACREAIRILPEHIYVDAGISGKRAEKRPEFMRMIGAAKEKDCPFSTLLLWKFSRFSRNQEEAIFYKSVLRTKCGVDVISITEPLLAGHFGSLVERIIEWMDEFYSVRLSEEVKRSMEVNARRGKLQTVASFGYRVENGRLTPEPDEARFVERIFQGYLSGKGLFSIAKELNAMGVRTHRGNPFESRTVEYILSNPVYIGKLRWNPEGRTRRDFTGGNLIVADADHKPLISRDIWEAAQQRLQQEKQKAGHKARPESERKHWLSGVVRCACCGGTLIFSKPHYFKCSNYTKGRCKHSQHIRADELADALLAKLAEDAGCGMDPNYEVVCRGEKTECETDCREIALQKLRNRKHRLQDAYLSGMFELEDFAQEKERLDAEMMQLERDSKRIHKLPDDPEEKNALQYAICAALQSLTIPNETIEQKNHAIRSVIDRCTWDKQNRTLSITYGISL